MIDFDQLRPYITLLALMLLMVVAGRCTLFLAEEANWSQLGSSIEKSIQSASSTTENVSTPKCVRVFPPRPGLTLVAMSSASYANSSHARRDAPNLYAYDIGDGIVEIYREDQLGTEEC